MSLTATVNTSVSLPITVVATDGSGVTGKVNSDFTKSAYLVSTPATTATATVTEVSGGDYAFAFTPTAIGNWQTKAVVTVSGTIRTFEETVQVVAAAASADVDAIVAGVVAALAGVAVTLVSPLSVDGGKLTLVQGDSYAAAQSRQLSWSLTGQPDLTTATVTLTIVSGSTLAKTAASVTNPASGSPTIAFVLTAAETAAFTPAKVGTFDLSATIGSDEITLARGRVFVEEDV